MTILNNLKELDIYNMLGLIEIAKKNQMFDGYWNFERIEFNRQFANLLDNKMLITIPNMDYKLFKKTYKKDLDCFDNDKQQNDNLILRKEYLSNLAKEKYKNDFENKNRKKETSRKYYQNLKKMSENKKNDFKFCIYIYNLILFLSLY